MEQRIIKAMNAGLETSNATTATTQQNCENWDSLRHLNLIVELEAEFAVEFDPEEIAQMKSYADIKAALEAKTSDK